MISLVKPRFKFFGVISSVCLLWILVTFSFRNPLAPSGGDSISADDTSSDVIPAKRIDAMPAWFDGQKGQLIWSVLTKIDALLKNNHSSFKVQLHVSPNDIPEQEERHQTHFELPPGVSPPILESDGPKFIPNSKTVRNTQPEFQPATTPAERAILYDLTVKFTVMCHLLNITYIMYGGTLLGSYRHHDLIPWDDDIDLIVDRRQRDKLYDSLLTLPSEYRVIRAGSRFKFFHTNSQRTSKYPWKWPYIDISFFYQNETHIWDSAWEFRNYVYNKDIVFPLHDRPFGDLLLKSPRDAFANLKITYKKKIDCTTHFYSHKYEKSSKKDISIPCKGLNDVVSFVHRGPSEAGVRETLMLGPKVLHSIVVEEPSYAISSPYRLELIHNNPLISQLYLVP